MSVDPKHHRYFVARRGQVLRDLADEYGGVMVSFPRTGSLSEKVTLKGAKECVDAAKRRMLEIVDDLVSRFFFFLCFSNDSSISSRLCLINLAQLSLNATRSVVFPHDVNTDAHLRRCREKTNGRKT